MSRLTDIIREPNWLTPARLRSYGIQLFVFEIAVLLFIAVGQHGLIVPIDIPIPTSFSSFWTAGLLAWQGTPLLAYDVAAHKAAQFALYSDSRIIYNFFFYPPPLLLLLWPLGGLPYLVAFYAWVVAQAICYLAALRAVVGRGASLLPYIAFPVAGVAFALGQNSLLTASIFAAGTAALGRGRPFLAGLILGCLIYKPHFGLLLPVAFLAGREWRVVAGAVCSVTALCLAATLAFGWEVWPAYLHLFGSTAQSTFEDGVVKYHGMVSAFGAAMMLGAPSWLAWTMQGILSLGTAAVVGVIWWRRGDVAPRMAALVAGSVLAMPVILFYDLLPGAVAMAWLAVAARKNGWMPWEKAGLALVFAVALLARPVAMGFGLPIGILAGAVLLALAWRRAMAPSM